MTSALISFLVLALILFVVYFVVGKFVQGTPLQIVGIILGIVLLVRGLQLVGVSV